MSSDARIRFQKDGQLRGTHDSVVGGFCPQHPLVSKYELSQLMRDIEWCTEQRLCWEIQDSGKYDDEKDEAFYLAGWCAR